MTGRKRLSSVLGRYAHTLPLKDGRVASTRFALDQVEVNPVTSAFAPMVNNQRFDVCEMALATYLQARDAGAPITLLPIVLVGQFPHRFLVHRDGGPISGPQDLDGSRIGVRAYSVTTGLWVRGIMAQQYGVDLSSIEWLTFEPPHVSTYVNPPNVKRAPEGTAIQDLLRDGQIDAAIGGGPLLSEPDFNPTVGDPEAAARDWYRTSRMVPINHMVTIRTELARQSPEVVPELMSMFRAAKTMAGPGDSFEQGLGTDPTPIGRKEIEPALSLAIEFAYSQGLITHPFTTDELFDSAAEHAR
jgi:4,5-dihydroxyphthalate decarboxylase